MAIIEADNHHAESQEMGMIENRVVFCLQRCIAVAPSALAIDAALIALAV